MCTPKDIAKIINMAASGVPIRHIADAVGASTDTVEKVLDSYQVDYEPVEMDHYVLKPKLVAVK